MKKLFASWTLAAVLFAPAALPASDNFNRATESPLAGNWTNTAGSGNEAQLDTNAVFFQTGAALCMAYWNADAFNGNHYSQITLASYDDTTKQFAVAVRVQSGTVSGYYFGAWVGVYEIGRIDSGTATAITTGLGTPAAGDVLKLEVSGTTLTAYVDGASVGTGATTSGGAAITGGAAGITGYGGALGGTLDNWEGGDVGGVTACPTCAKVNSPIRGGGLRAFFRF
jgi:hypothetical protein